MNQLQHREKNATGVLKKTYKKPSLFLLPTPGFYLLTVAIALILFFIISGILEEFENLKPMYYKEIINELEALKINNLQILKVGKVYNF